MIMIAKTPGSQMGSPAAATVRTPDRARNSFSIVIKSGQTRRAVGFTVHAHAALCPVVAARELLFNRERERSLL